MRLRFPVAAKEGNSAVRGAVVPPHRLLEGSEYMKTLNTIQKLARLGMILSKIAFVFSVIGAVGSVVGIISMALGAGTVQSCGNTPRRPR